MKFFDLTKTAAYVTGDSDSDGRELQPVRRSKKKQRPTRNRKATVAEVYALVGHYPDKAGARIRCTTHGIRSLRRARHSKHVL